MVFGGRWAGLSLLETSDLLGFSHATISRIFREWSEKRNYWQASKNALSMPEENGQPALSR